MINERHEAQGDWSVMLKPTLPSHIWSKLLATGHLVVTDSRPDHPPSDAVLGSARWVGVNMLDPSGSAGSAGDGYYLEGRGASWWLGDHERVGPIFEDVNLDAATFANAIRAFLPAAVAEGTLYGIAGTITERRRYTSSRESIDYICSIFDATWRIRPDPTDGLVLDAGTYEDLFGPVPTGLAVRGQGGPEPTGKVGLPTNNLSRRVNIDELTRKVILLAEGAGDAVKTGSADYVGADPYLDIRGNAIERTRLISESDTSEGNATARAQLQLNRFVNADDALTLELDDYAFNGEVEAGGQLDVYDPELGLVDPANPVAFRGETVWPKRMRVRAVTWGVAEGMGVLFRAPDGEWLDLTDHVVPESSSVVVEFGRARTIRDTSEPVGVRLQDTGGDDGLTPATPANLTVAGQSNYLTGDGATRTRALVSWDTPVLNGDGSTVTDGDRYEVRFAVSGSGEWAKAIAGWDESSVALLDLSPGVTYDVQVRAVDQFANASAWSATVALVAQEDAIAPSQPAAPVVAGNLLNLLVSHDLGVAGGGTYNLEDDLHHLEVHASTVGAAFLPDAASHVGDIMAGKAMLQAGIPALGSFEFEDTATRYVKVIAVDRAGNKSDASAAATATATLVDTAHITNLAVTDAKINTLTASKITAGVIGVADYIHSDNYVPGSAGWAIEGDGSAEFSNVTVRGEIIAETGEIVYMDVTGELRLSGGVLRTAAAGSKRIEINTSGTWVDRIEFYPAPDDGGPATGGTGVYEPGYILTGETDIGGGPRRELVLLSPKHYDGEPAASITLETGERDSATGTRVRISAEDAIILSAPTTLNGSLDLNGTLDVSTTATFSGQINAYGHLNMVSGDVLLDNNSSIRSSTQSIDFVRSGTTDYINIISNDIVSFGHATNLFRADSSFLRPTNDGVMYLGASNYRWREFFVNKIGLLGGQLDGTNGSGTYMVTSNARLYVYDNGLARVASLHPSSGYVDHHATSFITHSRRESKRDIRDDDAVDAVDVFRRARMRRWVYRNADEDMIRRGRPAEVDDDGNVIREAIPDTIDPPDPTHGRERTGWVAEEAPPEVVVLDRDGNPEGIDLMAAVALLGQAIADLDARIPARPINQ